MCGRLGRQIITGVKKCRGIRTEGQSDVSVYYCIIFVMFIKVLRSLITSE